MLDKLTVDVQNPTKSVGQSRATLLPASSALHLPVSTYFGRLDDNINCVSDIWNDTPSISRNFHKKTFCEHKREGGNTKLDN